MRKIVLDFGWGRQYLFHKQEDAFKCMSLLAQATQFEKDGIGSGVSEKTELNWYSLDPERVEDEIRLQLLAGDEK